MLKNQREMEKTKEINQHVTLRFAKDHRPIESAFRSRLHHRPLWKYESVRLSL